MSQYAPVNAPIKQGDSALVVSSVVERDSSGDSSFRNVNCSGYLDSGGLNLGIVSKTANYTATTSDFTIVCDATSGAITITLPAAASSSGVVLVIKKVDNANNVVIDGNASETIDGATTVTLSTQYHFRVIHCNGTSWHVIGS